MDIQKTVRFLQSKGLTQKKIAEAIGCAQPTISCFLHGRNAKRPSSKTVDGLRKLIAQYGINDRDY